MDLKLDAFVLPGDVVGRISSNLKVLRLGPGLYQDCESIKASRAGILRCTQPENTYWVDHTSLKRYIPNVDDLVIGVVKQRHGDNFKLDIGSANLATLPMIAYEGASRKNKLNFKINQLVYARVVVANKDMEPELSCTGRNGKPDGFGLLSGGYAFDCSLGLSLRLMEEKCVVLNTLGTTIPYEIAVGMNGRVWINSDNLKSSILISNAILLSEKLTNTQQKTLVEHLIAKAKER